MVKHIVAWRIADGEDKKKRAEDIEKNLESLKGIIPGLLDIEVGINISEKEFSSDVVLVSVFASKEDVEKYQNNPEHKAVGQSYVLPYVKERRVIDYEI